MAWLERITERALAAVHTHLDEAALAEAWERGRALSADEAVALALAEVGSDA
jgi:hypothetical protein